MTNSRLQGVPEDTGIMPRSLDVIFNSIADAAAPEATLKPHCFCDTVEMTPEAYAKHTAVKNQILAADTQTREGKSLAAPTGVLFPPSFLPPRNHRTHTIHKSTSRPVTRCVCSVPAKLNAADALCAPRRLHAAAVAEEPAMVTEDDDDADTDEAGLGLEIDALATEQRIRDATTVPITPGAEYSVFVSYAEVYNECVYDLLTVTPKSKGKNPRRDTCRIGEKNGNPYIRDLREVQVTDSDDAIRIICAGQRNRKVAATGSNQESSRSHCLFTVKVIKRKTADPAAKPTVNQLTIVDLAGSERYKKTGVGGDRIKEAGTINTSLMTLGKCMDVLRWNQDHKSKQPRVVPYRDSKLTRLFKYYLDGKGMSRMIVNIADVTHSFDETSHCLKFSALARKVTAAPVTSKIDTGINKLQRELEQSHMRDLDEHESYAESLLNQLHDVKQQLVSVQMQAQATEQMIREEVADEMAEQMAEMEEEFQNAMTAKNEATEQRYQKKWGVFTRSVARLPAVSRTGAGDAAAGDAAAEALADARAEIARLKVHVEDLELSMDDGAALAAAEHDAAGLKARVSDLEADAAEADEEIEALKNHIDEIEAAADNAAEYRSGVSDANKKVIEVLKAEKTAQNAAHEAKLGELEAHISELEDDIAEKSIELASSKSAAAENESAADALAESDRRYDELEARYSTVLKEKKLADEKHRDAIDELSQAHRAQQLETVEASDAMRQGLESRLAELESDLAAADLECGNAVHQAKSNQAQIEDLTASRDAFEELKDKHARLDAQFTKTKQQNALAVATFKRKLKSKEDSIQTLEATIEAEEAKTDKLSAQLAGYLGEQMESSIADFAATPRGASLQRQGSISLRGEKLRSLATPQHPEAPAAAEPEGGPTAVVSAAAPSPASVPAPVPPPRKGSKAKLNVPKRGSKTALDVPLATTSNRSSSVRSSRATRAARGSSKASPKRKAEAANDADLDKENMAVATPVGKEAAGFAKPQPTDSATKKKRRLFQKGKIDSPACANVGVLGSAKKPAKVAQLLTPIRRRLRSRKNK